MEPLNSIEIHEIYHQDIRFFEINDIKNIDIQLKSTKIDETTGIYIKNENHLIFLENNSIFKHVNYFMIPFSLIESKHCHFLYSIGKQVYCMPETEQESKIIELNPTICSIKNNQTDKMLKVVNMCFYLDVERACVYLGRKDHQTFISEKIKSVWGHFGSYYIFNVDQEWSKETLCDCYYSLSCEIGELIKARPVNSEKTAQSYSRDVKYVPGENHFYASNIMQPLHNDFAYFTYKNAADYLSLFCIKNAEYGGITSLLKTQTLRDILEKYNPSLYEKLEINFTYKSQVDADGNFDIHDKLLFDKTTNFINWNNFQIKPEYNDAEKINIRNEFHTFLYEFISKGLMYDLNIVWKRGDCIIFNDHLNLHTRSSFLGRERWLSGYAMFEK